MPGYNDTFIRSQCITRGFDERSERSNCPTVNASGRPFVDLFEVHDVDHELDRLRTRHGSRFDIWGASHYPLTDADESPTLAVIWI